MTFQISMEGKGPGLLPQTMYCRSFMVVSCGVWGSISHELSEEGLDLGGVAKSLHASFLFVIRHSPCFYRPDYKVEFSATA